MVRQLKQVAITYITHRYILAGALFVLLVAVPSIIGMSAHHTHPEDVAPPMLFALGMPPLFLARYLVGHAKSQFGHWRARLIPNFLPSHVAVLSACLILLLGVYPILLAIFVHAQPAGFIAYALAIATPSIWVAHRGRGFGILISLLVLYSVFTDWGAHWWILDSAQHWCFQAAIIATCAALLVRWLRRVCVLREEMPDYQTSMNWRVTRPGGGEVIEQRRVAAAQICRSPLITRISDAWLARLPAADIRSGRPSLARLLIYGFGPWPAELSAAFIGLMMALVTLFMADFATFAHGAEAGTLNIFIFFATFMPAFSAGESLAQRRPRIATELLRPFTRQQLVDGLFVAAARNTVAGWLIQNVLLALVAWHVLGGQLTPMTITFYVTLSAAAAFAMWGLSLRISVCQSQFKRLLAAMAPWSVAAAIGAAVMTHSAAVDRGAAMPLGHFDFWPISPLVAVFLIAVGAALVVNARRAWLNLELG